MNLPSKWVEEHLKTSIISRIIYNLRKALKFGLFLQYISQKWTKTLHFEVVLYIILTSFILFLEENCNMCNVNIRRVYATNKNKLSIIIWTPTVNNLNFSKVINYGKNCLIFNSASEARVANKLFINQKHKIVN